MLNSQRSFLISFMLYFAVKCQTKMCRSLTVQRTLIKTKPDFALPTQLHDVAAAISLTLKINLWPPDGDVC